MRKLLKKIINKVRAPARRDPSTGPHPNGAHAAWGRRARRLEPDPQAAHVVRWIFEQRLPRHSGRHGPWAPSP